ncbi:MAG TPA: succinate dehydrogenase flavoprotein subunit [Candidatus Sulfotelmatobacter sp.]|nr:succinate dehydrogenase flavoprotein subunit [Candidatus Sulfotelmatobacter sp.]
MAQPRFIVVGGGLAGLMTTIKICEAGHPVDLFSVVPVKRSHSVCAQGGINASVNIKGEGDSPQIHFYETIKGGDFLANQPLAKGMCEAAPGIIFLLDRMGVPFNRTPEGNLDFRGFGGTLFSRTAFVGATTGQQLLYALDEQVRRYEAEGLVEKYEFWDFLSAVLDGEAVCRGIVAQDLRTMEIKAFPADAVCLATGGCGIIYGKSTMSMVCTGTAASAVYQQGAIYANGEFIQVHPTAIPGPDKLRLMSESARAEGGRVWVPRDGKPWYFLEEKYPKYGNLVPRDIASREIFHVCRVLKLGVDGKDVVYLDLSHIPAETLNRKLGGILEIYEKFVGDDPRKVPMRVFPGVHYSMGGLWIDFQADAQGNPTVGSPRNHQTNIPGLFAAGEVDYEYHGANRLGANSLLSTFYGGMLCGPAMVSYAKGLDRSAAAVATSVFEAERQRQQELTDRICRMDGKESPYVIHKELGEVMTDNVTVVRYNENLQTTDNAIRAHQERWRRINIEDAARWANQAVPFTRALWNMLELARVITLGALRRDESRGAHYKPDFPERNDQQWLKTTKATWTPEGPALSYDPVDISLLTPEARKY